MFGYYPTFHILTSVRRKSTFRPVYMEASFPASRVSRQGGLINCQFLHVTGKLVLACLHEVICVWCHLKAGKESLASGWFQRTISKNLGWILMIQLCFACCYLICKEFVLHSACVCQTILSRSCGKLGYLRLHEFQPGNSAERDPASAYQDPG